MSFVLILTSTFNFNIVEYPEHSYIVTQNSQMSSMELERISNETLLHYIRYYIQSITIYQLSKFYNIWNKMSTINFIE